MATISQDRDRVCLDLCTLPGDPPTDSLMLALRYAETFAEGLHRYAGQAAISKESCGYSSDPKIDIQATVDGGRPRLLLKFAGPVTRLHLSPRFAVYLAGLVETAVRKMYKHLKWLEERYPQSVVG